MAFVQITRLPNPSLQLQATALLHDMGGLMRRCMQVWRGSERHVASGSERLGLHAPRARCRRGIGMGLDIADVMAAEQALNRASEWQRLRGPSDTVRCGGVNIRRRARARARRCFSSLRSWCRFPKTLHQRLLAGCYGDRIPTSDRRSCWVRLVPAIVLRHCRCIPCRAGARVPPEPIYRRSIEHKRRPAVLTHGDRRFQALPRRLAMHIEQAPAPRCAERPPRRVPSGRGPRSARRAGWRSRRPGTPPPCGRTRTPRRSEARV